MNDRTATEATELDKARRYLRPVAAYDSAEVHLSVYSWLAMFEAWATGPGLCGQTMRQGPLPEGTEVTCADCLHYQARYERMLAPGYRPEDDDPDALRVRITGLADTLAAELHRRWLRLNEIHKDLDYSDRTAMQLHGEVIGLRGALGIALGGAVAGGDADRMGVDYHQAWMKRTGVKG